LRQDKEPDPGVLSPNIMWAVIAVGAIALFSWTAMKDRDQTAEPVAVLRVATPDGVRNERVVQVDCRKDKDRVWVATPEAVECIAYVASRSEPPSEIGIVFFNGDVPEADRAKETTAAVRDLNARQAAALTAKSGLTTIIVGRPGLMGSTGFHQPGGMAEDAHIINAALDTIKQTFGLKRLALAGQSGGARLIAQLMTLGRDDIRCAAMASGAYGLPGLRGGGTVGTNVFGDAGRRYMIPLKDAASVMVNKDRRSFIIGDPSDKITGFAEQREWSEKLASLGHHSVLVTGRATDENNHGLASAALAVAATCANGRPDAEVIAAVAIPK
jgi:pimeloyl-ACP methyl ester carboxylesterase